MNDVRNDVINKFKLDDELSRIQFSLQEPLKFGKFKHFAEKFVFWSNLEAPKEKTVYLRKLVMIFKVVNNIVEIIYFDQNAVRSNLNELCIAQFIQI